MAIHTDPSVFACNCRVAFIVQYCISNFYFEIETVGTTECNGTECANGKGAFQFENFDLWSSVTGIRIVRVIT